MKLTKTQLKYLTDLARTGVKHTYSPSGDRTSRILERHGLVSSERGPRDGGVVKLTEAGRALLSAGAPA